MHFVMTMKNICCPQREQEFIWAPSTCQVLWASAKVSMLDINITYPAKKTSQCMALSQIQYIYVQIMNFTQQQQPVLWHQCQPLWWCMTPSMWEIWPQTVKHCVIQTAAYTVPQLQPVKTDRVANYLYLEAVLMILWGVLLDTGERVSTLMNRCVLADVDMSGVPCQDTMGAVGGWQS